MDQSSAPSSNLRKKLIDLSQCDADFEIYRNDF